MYVCTRKAKVNYKLVFFWGETACAWMCMCVRVYTRGVSKEMQLLLASLRFTQQSYKTITYETTHQSSTNWYQFHYCRYYINVFMLKETPRSRRHYSKNRVTMTMYFGGWKSPFFKDAIQAWRVCQSDFLWIAPCFRKGLVVLSNKYVEYIRFFIALLTKFKWYLKLALTLWCYLLYFFKTIRFIEVLCNI